MQSVLDTLIPKEVEVHNNDGKWYSMRMVPYRTLENMIEGAVLSFVEITAIVQAREALEKANNLLRMAVVVRDASDAITVMGIDGQILAWNPGAVRLYGWSEAEALTMNRADMIPSELRKEFSARLEKLSHSEILEPYQTNYAQRAQLEQDAQRMKHVGERKAVFV